MKTIAILLVVVVEVAVFATMLGLNPVAPGV